ncbi:PREDICTED: mediator of RNA polymerase II transcription subunit 15a-like isoform X1 [Lupinus angustifolius]|uniref:mediator of RNA polymerase II transcription subunit 15a-like isoform X1 n=1 Tax=Lupinus angustifolius TaxID=3871 RepID=UPI00092EF44E|nr:PREDICTED: mediator of RNA polymerase II transcription subunit 15a-like isoform X1 [Lupinus angustifolius]
MDANRTKPITDAANIEAIGWKSTEGRKRMKKKIEEFIIMRAPPSWKNDLSKLTKFIEMLEEKVFASVKDEAEYIAKLSAKLKTLSSAPPQSAESNLSVSNPSGSGAEREVNVEWQEQLYQKVQTMRSTYVTKLDFVYKELCRKLQQLESVPQQPKTSDIEKLRHHKQSLECIFSALKVNRNQITPDYKQKLDQIEKYIHSISKAKMIPSHHQKQHSADVHSVQQFVPSHSRNSEGEISEKKPTLQSTSPQNSYSTNQSKSTQTIQTHLKDQQVANRFNISQQQAKETSIIKGCGTDVQQQTNGQKKSPEAFVIRTPGVSASLLFDEFSNVNGTSHNATVISDDPSTAMQRLIKVLSSMSDEALMASSGEIGAVVRLNDCISTLEPLNLSPDSEIDTNLEGVNDADLQTRYMTYDDFVQRGREMNRFINSMPTSETFFHRAGAENPYSSSFTSQLLQENYTLFDEIKKINNRLIDTEVVIDEEKTFISASGRVDEHSKEGMLVKLIFNSTSVDVNLISQYASSNKKSIIKPLRILVPSSYPLCSPFILDEMPLKISEEMDDLSMKAKFRLRLSLQSLHQPMSLRDIATSWDHCAREAIFEFAKLHGGGTFSSKYGGWEICHYDG